MDTLPKTMKVGYQPERKVTRKMLDVGLGVAVVILGCAVAMMVWQSLYRWVEEYLDEAGEPSLYGEREPRY